MHDNILLSLQRKTETKEWKLGVVNQKSQTQSFSIYNLSMRSGWSCLMGRRNPGGCSFGPSFCKLLWGIFKQRLTVRLDLGWISEMFLYKTAEWKAECFRLIKMSGKIMLQLPRGCVVPWTNHHPQIVLTLKIWTLGEKEVWFNSNELVCYWLIDEYEALQLELHHLPSLALECCQMNVVRYGPVMVLCCDFHPSPCRFDWKTSWGNIWLAAIFRRTQ